ncbi:MAG: C-terminal binding protein [Candidatus Bathyarchaeia archaeon]
MARPKVVVTDHVYPSIDVEGKILTSNGFDFRVYQCKGEDEVVEACWDADGILTTFAPITRRVIGALNKAKVIVRHGVGYDNIDVSSASEKGIMVVNIPDFGGSEVADHTLALIISLLRRIPQYDRLVKSGGWSGWAAYRPLHPLYRLTLGVVGFGRIGRQVALKAMRGFDMKVVANDPYVALEEFESLHVTPLTLEELLRISDVVSLHTPLTDETRHLIDQEKLKLMKPSAILVNTSRGPVIDQEALVEALRKGWISGAALDVLASEPPGEDEPLLGMENVILTPHVAWFSEESFIDLLQKAAYEVVRALKGEEPLHIVNRSELAERGYLKTPIK